MDVFKQNENFRRGEQNDRNKSKYVEKLGDVF